MHSSRPKLQYKKQPVPLQLIPPIVKKIHDILFDEEKKTATRNLPKPFERHWSIAAQWNRALQSVAHCSVGFSQSPGFCKKTFSPPTRANSRNMGGRQ